MAGYENILDKEIKLDVNSARTRRGLGLPSSGDFRFIYRGGLSPQIKIKALSFQYKYTPQN